MTDKTRAAFEAIYGKRGATSLAVASWDARFEVWKLSRKQGIEAERERICAAIKAEDDHCSLADYMLDSDDCIKVVRGTWERPYWGTTTTKAKP